MVEIKNELSIIQYIKLRKLIYNFYKCYASNKSLINRYTKTIFKKMVEIDVFPLLSINKKNFYLFYENELVGYLKAQIYDDGVGYISQVYIDSSYRNVSHTGEILFKLLLKDVENWFNDNNINLLEFEILKKNDQILNLVNKKRCLKIEEYEDSYVYQKKIKDNFYARNITNK